MKLEEKIADAVKLAILEASLGQASSADINETAFATSEIAGCAKRISTIYDALLTERSPALCLSLLEDFREELRHILYHVGDNLFFSVIIGSTESKD